MQLGTDVSMTITYCCVALTCVDQVIVTLWLTPEGSETVYAEATGSSRESSCGHRFLHFVATMRYRELLLSAFIVLIAVIIIVVMILDKEGDVSLIGETGHIIMSTLVMLANMTLVGVSIIFSHLLRPILHMPLAARLRRRILALCLTAGIIGVLRFPFDMCVATKTATIPDNPFLMISLAIFLRYTHSTLICILMWPLPSMPRPVRTVNSSQEWERGT